MISKLRRKFIIIAMLSVTVYWRSDRSHKYLQLQKCRDADNVDYNTDLTNNGVSLKEMPQSAMRDQSAQTTGGEKTDQMSPEMRFEARFFKSPFNEKRHVISSDTGRIAAVDSSRAEALAETYI